MNTLRAILVGTAAVAAVVAVVLGEWLVALVMVAAILVHGVLWLFLPRLYDRGEGR